MIPVWQRQKASWGFDFLHVLHFHAACGSDDEGGGVDPPPPDEGITTTLLHTPLWDKPLKPVLHVSQITWTIRWMICWAVWNRSRRRRRKPSGRALPHLPFLRKQRRVRTVTSHRSERHMTDCNRWRLFLFLSVSSSCREEEGRSDVWWWRWSDGRSGLRRNKQNTRKRSDTEKREVKPAS